MRYRGIGGFGIIVLLILILVLVYIAYQISRVHFTYGKIGGKVETTAQIGPSLTDQEIINIIVKEGESSKVNIDPDSIFVDRGIVDSFRIYVAYDDSSDIFGVFTYRHHFVVDKVEATKVRF
jgi:hypothetical protein